MIGSGQAKHSALQLGKQVEAVLKTAINTHLSDAQLQHRLQQLHGIGAISSQKILASLELYRRLLNQSSNILIDAPTKLLPLVAHLLHKRQEYCLAFYLNGRQELLKQQTLAVGGLNYNFLEAREIFAPAFIHGATSLVLVHNHPSGDHRPSTEDVELTARVAELADLLGYRLLDHLVVSRVGYTSLRQTQPEIFSGGELESTPAAPPDQ